MRPTLEERFLIEEGRDTWRIEDCETYLDNEMRRLACVIGRNAFDDFDDHGMAKYDMLDLRRYRNKFDAVHGIRPMHDFLDRLNDLDNGLGYFGDERLAADIEAHLWPDLAVLR